MFKAKKSILDYVSIGVLESIFDIYDDDYKGICLAINDMNENIVIARNFHPICANFHRGNEETEKLCIDSNRYITEHLEDSEYIEYKCKNGLVDIAFPIKMHGERIATFYTGQFFIEGNETKEDFFVEHAKKHGFELESYLKAVRTIRTLKRKEVDDLVKRIKKDIIELLNE